MGTPEAQTELAFIIYNGSGKYSETANAVVPLRTLDGNHRLEEPLTDRDTWWPVIQIWILGLWYGHTELGSLVHWLASARA